MSKHVLALLLGLERAARIGSPESLVDRPDGLGTGRDGRGTVQSSSLRKDAAHSGTILDSSRASAAFSFLARNPAHPFVLAHRV
jgi:hypothetical protein